MKYGKKILAIFLVLVTLTGMLPITGNAAQTVSTENEVSVSGTNEFGQLLSESISDAQQSQDAGVESGKEGYGVTALTIEGNIATVTYDAMEEAILLVALYSEENGQLICSGKTTVTAENTQATLTIEGEMPEFFEAAAFLLDTYDMSPLCPSYATPMYTKQMQELLASTAEDYVADGYEVLQLEEEGTTNFAVYNKSVVVIDYQEGINEVVSADADSGVYIFENCDEQITGLTTGAIMAYSYSENDLLLIKIFGIMEENNQVTIYADSLELEEVFDYLKIETGSNSSEIEVDPSTCEEGVTYEGLVEDKPATRAWDDEVILKKSLVFTVEKEFMTEGDNQVGAKINGTVTLGTEASLSYYISLKRQFVELKLELGIWANVQFSGVLKSTGMTLAEFKLPSPVWGIVFECAPKLIWEFEASSVMSGKVTAVVGFSYDSESGWQSLNQKPTHSTETSMEGKLFMGVELDTSACILDDDIASIGFSIRNGLQISGKMTGTEYEEIKENAAKRHTCDKCLSLRLDWVTRGSVFMKIIKIVKVEYVFLDRTIHIGDMYWSFDPDYGDSDFGKCPHYLYRVTVKVQDRNGDPVPDQQVFLSTGESLGKTGEKGTLATYVKKGNYTFQTTIDGETLKVDREVTNATRVVLTNNPEILKKLADAAAELIKALKVENHATYPAKDGGSGTFSSGVTWKIYRSGIMIIEGDGEMDSYSYSDIPWENLKDKIKAVEFRGDITNVCNYAFSQCYNLETVILADATVNIGYSAFQGCTQLENIRLPANYRYNSSSFLGCNNVEKIQYGCPEDGIMPNRQASYTSSAYYYGYSLEYIAQDNLNTVIFEEGIENVADYAFYGSSALQKVFLCSTITEIGEYAFHSSGIAEIEFPESLESIKYYAFAGSKLTAVEFPESLESIGSYAFDACSGLTELVIPDGLAKTMGYGAFRNCTGLTKITLPVDYAVLSSGIFEYCSNVESIHYTCGENGVMQERNKTYSNRDDYQPYSLEYYCRRNLKHISFDEGITRIGDYAFDECSALEYVELPSTLQSIGDYAFRYCGFTQIEFHEGLTDIEYYAFAGSKLTAVEFPESLESIGSYAFDACSGLTELVIPDKLAKTMGYGAFRNCTGLTKITLPVDYAVLSSGIFEYCSNVEYIHYTCGENGVMQERNKTYSNRDGYQPYSLEYYCRRNLKHISFDEGITRIGDYAFDECSALEHVELPSTLQSIGEYAFRYCGFTQIEFHEGLTDIEYYAFAGSKLTAVEFPESLESIGSYAFDACSGLTELVIPDKLAKSMGYGAFRNCTGLVKITLPVDYAVLSGGIFEGCSNVESIHYTCGENGVMQERNKTYSNRDDYQPYSLEYYCRRNLKHISFDEGITRIGDYAFDECSALEHVELPSTLQSIGDYAFRYCGFTQIEFHEGLTDIEFYAFAGSKLTAVEFPESLESIGSYAFDACSGLTAIAFTGNAPNVGYDIFRAVTATAYYPVNNATWTADKLTNYGGTLTWEAYTPEQKSIRTGGQSASASASAKVKEEAKKPENKAIFGGEYSCVEIDGQIVHTAYFENLQPGKEYAMIAVIDPNAEDLLAYGNLLAIMQAPAESDGTLVFDYIPRQQADISYVFATGASHQDVNDAVITFPAMVSNGQAQTIEPVVTYNGKVLTEEVDYIILGDVDYTEAGDYTCYIRGVREYTGLVTCRYTVMQTGISTWNISLSDRIAVNFRIAADPGAAQWASVRLTVDEETQTIPLTQLTQDAKTGEYLIRADLAAAQMTEEVLVQIVSQDQILFEKAYTVAQYAAYIFDPVNGYDMQTVDLVRQMLHYGAGAQLYFGYRTEDLANTGIYEGWQDAMPTKVPVDGAVDPSPVGFTLVGMSLVFDDYVSVRFYFNAANPESYTFAVGGEELTPYSKNGMYYVEVTDLVPQDWEQEIALQVNGNVCARYSPVNYMVNMYHKTEKETLQTLLLAMYRYYLAALSYCS